MALEHPGKVPTARTTREIHPVFGLVAGFGLICLAATAVHVLFSLV